MAIDHKFFMDNLVEIKKTLTLRQHGFDVEAIESQISERNNLQRQHDECAAKAKETSSSVGKLFQAKAPVEEIEQAKKSAQALKTEVQTISESYAKISQNIAESLLALPNLLDASVIEGKDESENVCVSTWGEPKAFSFKALPHDVLGEALNGIDFERGAKVAGARFTVLSGWAAKLERALVNFMLDQHREAGYQEISVPFLVNRMAMTGTGQWPKFSDEAFQIADPELYLIPTAEVPVTNIYANEVLDEASLPISYAAYSPCFRREAGSHGQDTKGLIRQHQFHKVELMRFVHPNESEALHESLTKQAEKILQLLELPYKKMALCSGDIGFTASKTYDLEVWVPSQAKYREISSCSNFKDFQARRANIRFKGKSGGKPQFVHTLNGSGLAVGRTMVALIENYQKEDGSIELPKILSPYMQGMLRIENKK